MLKRIAALWLVLIFLMGSAIAEKAMYVNNPKPNDRLNLRRYPTQESPSLGKYCNGCIVK